MKITREDVLRVAELAHLELSPQELETYRGQLDEILDYIEKLKELDVENVAPMAQVVHRGAGLAAASEPGGQPHPELRDDVVQPCVVAKAVLSGSSEAAPPFFRAPRVIER
ncbi:MAG TPA: Asp-tRNA(Asn)/Glu-tRNA(Gln) amidotransferase subunit GatC [Candidatus Acidoferrales bacterium]|nr:Asp-tRNA(Asn)/Glu-tRNA(Gln) amidotransferase subunit GatC [Candidatus Acidoferrales bacterium]